MTPEEMFCTLAKVKELYEFTKKQSPRIWLSVGRRNGKTLMLRRFMREYKAVLVAYERAERKVEARLRRSQVVRDFASKIRMLFKPNARRVYKSWRQNGYSARYVVIDEMHEHKREEAE